MKMVPVWVMIILHAANGIEIDVNTETITHLKNPDPKGSPHFTADVQCMINMNDGKFVTVKETCAEVKRIIERR